MRSSGRYLLVVAALMAVLLLAVACEEGEEETPTPGDTPAATVVDTPTAAAAESPGITDTEILLGADVPLSGAFGAVYATIPQATGAYFKYINETQGGVCGREIVYKVEDNQDDPAKAMEVVRKLVEQDEVFAMVGSLGDSPHPATWDYLNENDVPDILVSVGSHMFGDDPEGHPWTVQMIPSLRTEGMFFGQYISENLPGKKVGVLIPNLIMGTDHLEGLKEGLDPDKNEIVSEQLYEITAVSISSQVTNLKNAGAEVITTNATPGFSAQAIKQADRMGWHPQWMLCYNNSDEMMFQFVSPEILEGAISFQALKLAAWTDDPAVAQHYEIMDQYGGPTPTNFTVYAQTLGEVAVEALSRSCDNLTREGLMDGLESIEEWHSDLLIDEVNITFSDTDHTALQTGKMLRAAVEDGKGKWEYFGPLVEFR
ncbi:MAG: ABC transporter substrate-binding protein [Dehalococcoidia bacterium]|nr:MAG: ABC transporter substrate-binding protein [Dehalococcoidia bacterium]